MVSLGQGRHVSLIGAPSKYSSRHVFNKLVDFREVNFLFAPFHLESKLSKQPTAYLHKTKAPGCKKGDKMVQCSIYTCPVHT